MTPEIIVAIFTSVMASTGFWSFVSKFSTSKKNRDALLLSLANQQMIIIGQLYIDRGYITLAEYKNFQQYLWEPYEQMGGNGLGKKIHDEIEQLPIRKDISVGK